MVSSFFYLSHPIPFITSLLMLSINVGHRELDTVGYVLVDLCRERDGTGLVWNGASSCLF